MKGAWEPEPISTGLDRIARLAQQRPEMAFTSLNHVLDLPLLEASYRKVNRKGASGVDGMTAHTYEKNLGANLADLLERAKSGRYRAPPVKRVHIPKGRGPETRAIGVPTLEDRILQRAVATILEQIYEQDFLPCSYGFRPGRSAHDAIEEVWQRTMRMRGCWLVEVDIQRFFDMLDHGHLRAMLDERIRDGVLRRLIHKWLHAGVMEAGNITYPSSGTPQGGVISPLLANLYLHVVLDRWFVREVVPRMKGPCYLVRYADDLVMGFTHEGDARKVLDVLAKRFGKYGLSLHPEKTKLVDFRQPGGRPDRGRTSGPPELARSFDFLGFTHIWGRSRKGAAVVTRRTSKSRFTRSMHALRDWCRMNRHRRVKHQAADLAVKLTGHYQYFGITGNYCRLAAFRTQVERIWRYWLNRRSQRRSMPWERFKRLLKRYPLPIAKVVHSVFRDRQGVLPFTAK